PHEPANRTQAPPEAPCCFDDAIHLVPTCRISHPFGHLFPTSGQVTYALLSRPPLTTRASPSRPFDLHVSCTPPAFILSQDQTLQKKTRPCGRDFVRRVYQLAHPSGFPATLHFLRCSPPGRDRLLPLARTPRLARSR